MQLMADHLPLKARQFLPYLRRADELENHFPMASFFCRLYVAETLNKNVLQKERNDDIEKIVIDQINKAEELKRKSEVKFSEHEFTAFCCGVLDGAMNELEVGNINYETLHSLYCATLFFDVMTQFGELSPEMLHRKHLAQVNAIRVKKQLDRGAVEHFEEQNDKISGNTNEFTNDCVKYKTTDATNIIEAQKLVQQAIYALSFHDAQCAKKFLKSALECLDHVNE